MTVGTLRRYHPSGLGYVLLTDAGRNCSGHHAADVWSSRACWSWVAGGRDAIGDTIRLVGVGQLHCWGAPAAPWSVGCLRLAHGCRSVPHGTFCDTMRWVCWLFVGSPGWSAGGRDAFGDTIRLGRCTPEVCWTFRAAKCFTCLREALGDSLLTFGLLLVWSEQVGNGCGSDPGGTASYLAHIKNVGRHPGRSPQTSHSAHTMQSRVSLRCVLCRGCPAWTVSGHKCKLSGKSGCWIRNGTVRCVCNGG